jgi:hypothetical protein
MDTFTLEWSAKRLPLMLDCLVKNNGNTDDRTNLNKVEPHVVIETLKIEAMGFRQAGSFLFYGTQSNCVRLCITRGTRKFLLWSVGIASGKRSPTLTAGFPQKHFGQ